MADSPGKIAAEVVTKNCPSQTCPYRFGDGDKDVKKLGERLEQKFKHRVADGNEVRVLEGRVASLEKALKTCLAKASSGATLSKAELEELKKVLHPPAPRKKDK